MNYEQLDPSYKYDVLADSIYGREVEYFHYDFDRQNFEAMLLQDIPEAARAEVSDRLASTLVQMEKVQSIYNALKLQVTDQVAYDAAVARAVLRRAAAKVV